MKFKLMNGLNSIDVLFHRCSQKWEFMYRFPKTDYVSENGCRAS